MANESNEEMSLGQLLEKKSIELENPDANLISGDEAGMNDIRQPVDRAGNEVENGPGVDIEDPNLSATMAEAGAEDRKDELGMRDEDEMKLDDPEQEDE